MGKFVLWFSGIFFLILLLLIILLLPPKKIFIEYDKADGFVVKIRLLFLKLQLWPLRGFLKKLANKKGKKPEEEIETEEKPSTKEKEKKSFLSEIEISFGLIKQVIASFGRVMKRVLRSFVVRDLSFTIPVYDPERWRLTEKYGRITGAFYRLNPLLQQTFRLYYGSPVFIADFGNKYSGSLYFYTEITASPALLLGRGVYAAKAASKIIKENKKASGLKKGE